MLYSSSYSPIINSVPIAAHVLALLNIFGIENGSTGSDRAWLFSIDKFNVINRIIDEGLQLK